MPPRSSGASRSPRTSSSRRAASSGSCSRPVSCSLIICFARVSSPPTSRGCPWRTRNSGRPTRNSTSHWPISGPGLRGSRPRPPSSPCWRRDPFTGMRDFHQGLDLVAPIGTKVIAPADGIVTKVGPSGGFGNSVFISHGYGIITRYGHLASYNVRVGQRVKRGDVIATVGSTGRSTGPHLHYELLVHQRNVDPIKYILEEYRAF